MIFYVAFDTESYSIIYIIPNIRIFRPTLNMMSINSAPYLLAIYTSKSISFKYLGAPGYIFNAVSSLSIMVCIFPSKYYFNSPPIKHHPVQPRSVVITGAHAGSKEVTGFIKVNIFPCPVNGK